LIISKDTFKKDKLVQEAHFHVAIVDEAHFLRNWKSAQSEAIFKLQSNVKYALTGTPSVKHGSDVYGCFTLSIQMHSLVTGNSLTVTGIS
jgi:SNF2 family DNA or RNA helicase